MAEVPFELGTRDGQARQPQQIAVAFVRHRQRSAVTAPARSCSVQTSCGPNPLTDEVRPLSATIMVGERLAVRRRAS
jgi:hypothetical protein